MGTEANLTRGCGSILRIKILRDLNFKRSFDTYIFLFIYDQDLHNYYIHIY